MGRSRGARSRSRQRGAAGTPRDLRSPTPFGQHRRRWSASLDRGAAPARGRTAGTVASPPSLSRPEGASATLTAFWTYTPCLDTPDRDGFRRLQACPWWSRGRPAPWPGLFSLHDRRDHAPQAVDAAGPMDAQTRPQVLAKPRRRGFARAPTALIHILDSKTGTNSPDETGRAGDVVQGSATQPPVAHTAPSVLPIPHRQNPRQLVRGIVDLREPPHPQSPLHLVSRTRDTIQFV